MDRAESQWLIARPAWPAPITTVAMFRSTVRLPAGGLSEPRP